MHFWLSQPAKPYGDGIFVTFALNDNYIRDGNIEFGTLVTHYDY